MRREGQARFHRVYTARLEVDYLVPLPAQSTIVCTAAVESFVGRKLWLTARVVAAPAGGEGDEGGVVYARSKSLFVVPRDDPMFAAAADGGGGETGVGAAAQNGAAA